MKITAYYMILNEEDWIDLSIKSIYPVVDEIIIVEGATQYAKFMSNEKGLSIDRTEERINTINDCSDKIKYFQIGFVDTMIDLKNFCLQKVSEDTDYIIILSGDEIYSASELENLFSFARQTDFNIFSVNHYLFFKSPCELIHHSEPMVFKKIYKYFPDMEYKEKSCDIEISFGERKKPIHFSYCNLYHFSFVKSKMRLLMKELWYLNFLIDIKKDYFGYARYDEIKDLSLKEKIELILRTNILFQEEYKWGILSYEGEMPFKKEIFKRYEEIKNKEKEENIWDLILTTKKHQQEEFNK